MVTVYIAIVHQLKIIQTYIATHLLLRLRTQQKEEEGGLGQTESKSVRLVSVFILVSGVFC